MTEGLAYERDTYERRVRRYYDAVAAAYDRRWAGYLDATHDLFDGWISPEAGERVLDLACGTGQLVARLTRRHPRLHVTGVDFSPAMLDLARARNAAGARSTFVHASADALPFADHSFDRVVCANAFHYFARPETVLNEVGRVLKPDGRLEILDWCRDFWLCKMIDLALWMTRPTYRSCYTLAELRALTEAASFEVEAARRHRLRVVRGLMLLRARSLPVL